MDTSGHVLVEEGEPITDILATGDTTMATLGKDPHMGRQTDGGMNGIRIEVDTVVMGEAIMVETQDSSRPPDHSSGSSLPTQNGRTINRATMWAIGIGRGAGRGMTRARAVNQSRMG